MRCPGARKCQFYYNQEDALLSSVDYNFRKGLDDTAKDGTTGEREEENEKRLTCSVI